MRNELFLFRPYMTHYVILPSLFHKYERIWTNAYLKNIKRYIKNFLKSFPFILVSISFSSRGKSYFIFGYPYSIQNNRELWWRLLLLIFIKWIHWLLTCLIFPSYLILLPINYVMPYYHHLSSAACAWWGW